jgi:aryl-alcohol dehydrogenase-like predicted oxidoreductase
MEAHAHTVLDAAWAGGIRYFDTARSYGDAERFLSTWLARRGIPAGAVTVGSKWGYTYTAGWKVTAVQHEVKDHTLAVLQRQIIESRNWLDGYLRLYQIHSATLESGVLEDQAVLQELARQRRAGLRIGLSLSGPRQGETLNQALAVRVEGERVFDCVQATWNLLEPSVGPALEAAHAAGLGVIIKEALANGRLTTRNRELGFGAKRQVLKEIAAKQETSVDALALAAVLAQPWVDVVLSGAAAVEQVHSNLRALSVRWNDDMADRLSRLSEDPQEYWRQRSQLSWN